jgi:hypothetical protein
MAGRKTIPRNKKVTENTSNDNSNMPLVEESITETVEKAVSNTTVEPVEVTDSSHVEKVIDDNKVEEEEDKVEEEEDKVEEDDDEEDEDEDDEDDESPKDIKKPKSKRITSVSALTTLERLKKTDSTTDWRKVISTLMDVCADITHEYYEKDPVIIDKGLRINLPPFDGHKSTLCMTVKKDAKGNIRVTLTMHDSFKQGTSKDHIVREGRKVQKYPKGTFLGKAFYVLEDLPVEEKSVM